MTALETAAPTTSVPSSKMAAKLGSPKFIKILRAFPSLSEDQIDFSWRHIYSLIPTDMTSFTDYFERTWIGTSARSPLFSHSMWNQHEDTQLMLLRSSNIVEG
jgi:hypothetical protein